MGELVKYSSRNMTGDVVILGYWDMRGLAGAIRLLLEFAGECYEDRRIVMPKPEWLEYKTGLGFDFPNLPFYQEGELKVTQSNAILRHLGRKHNLDAEDAVSSARLDMISDLVVDFRNMMTGICYNPDFSLDLLEKWRETTKLRDRMERWKRSSRQVLGSGGLGTN